MSDHDDNDSEEGMIMENMFACQSTDSESDDILTLKYDTYERKSNGEIIKLALVQKHHSLWAEFVYNAARLLADLMDCDHNVEVFQKIDVTGKRCLELGAGAGLPGIMAALKGASFVSISDYGHNLDLSLIYPIDENIRALPTDFAEKIYGVPYVWGYPIHPLVNPKIFYNSQFDLSSYKNYKETKLIEGSDLLDLTSEIEESDKFDIILLADLIFNRSQHEKLLWTVEKALKRGTGVCYVTFSHHDPQKSELDLNFFHLASQPPYNLDVKYIGKEQRQSYPFREQDGMDNLRGFIYLYELRKL